MPNIDAFLVQSATQRAKDNREDLIAKVEHLLVHDRDATQRLTDGFCQWCWYRRTVLAVGQAFTDYACRICGVEYTHPNTGVPQLCGSCGNNADLCRACCGDLYGRRRSKNDLKRYGIE